MPRKKTDTFMQEKLNQPAGVSAAVRIRSETAADVQAIAELTQQAFASAAHSDGNEQAIIAALRAAGALALSLVAEIDGAIVGHIALSPVQISDGSTGWYGLGPVSVLPARQGQGIGSQLMRNALTWLQQQRAAGCVVLGEPAYYHRFGFRAQPELVLPGVPAAYFMAQHFSGSGSGSGPMAQGIVRYHSAFGG